MAEIVERSLKAVEPVPDREERREGVPGDREERREGVPGDRDGSGAREYVLKRYDDSIGYYWKASRMNRRLYKWTRYLVIVLGAVVTLLASISSASGITGAAAVAVAIATPVLAAVLTIIGGLSQSFQWGAAWQEMVITAERLERERDRIRVTSSNPETDLDVLNTLVLRESEGFFMRILGSVQPSSPRPGETRP